MFVGGRGVGWRSGLNGQFGFMWFGSPHKKQARGGLGWKEP